MLVPSSMDYWPWLLLVFIWAMGHQQVVDGLFVTNIEVPEIVDYRARVTLSCSYNMSGHKLNSVKWYKDGAEFFRYSPMTPPTFSQFEVAGVTILSDNYYCNELTCTIDIGNLKISSSGAYRCEVSGDAPAFKLTSGTANMTVAVLPQHDPLINGVNPTYRLNDFIVANCSSDWSSPSATLTWYINDEKATSDLLQPLQETTMTTNGFNLRLRSLELRFVFDKHRDMMYARDVLKLKCVADINQIVFLRREKETTSYIIRDDNLRNSKLITSRSSANTTMLTSSSTTFVNLLFICTVLKNGAYIMSTRPGSFPARIPKRLYRYYSPVGSPRISTWEAPSDPSSQPRYCTHESSGDAYEVSSHGILVCNKIT